MDAMIYELINYLKSDQYHQDLYDYAHNISDTDYSDVEEEKGWYGCFDVAEFVRYQIKIMVMTLFENQPKEKNLLFLKGLSDGIYYIEIKNNYESHVFIMYLRQTEIIIINGYGGYVGNPIVVFSDKKEWLESFLNLNQLSYLEQIDTLEKLFNYPRDIMENVYDYKKDFPEKIKQKDVIMLQRLI